MSKLKIISIIGIVLILVVVGWYLSKTQEESEIAEPQNLKLFEIKDHSMEPTLNIGDKVKVDLDYYKENKPKRDDFIVFKFKTREETFVKRVIAIEGEKVEMQNGTVYINDAELQEFYAQKDNSNFTLKTVSEDFVFVLGDNRDYSFDSRDWGFLPMSRVIGKVIEK